MKSMFRLCWDLKVSWLQRRQRPSGTFPKIANPTATMLVLQTDWFTTCRHICDAAGKEVSKKNHFSFILFKNKSIKISIKKKKTFPPSYHPNIFCFRVVEWCSWDTLVSFVDPRAHDGWSAVTSGTTLWKKPVANSFSGSAVLECR